MPNVIGAIPEFTSDEGTPPVEVKEETVTPSEPAETAPPAEEKPVEETVETVIPNDEEKHELEGLRNERVKLLKEISELRGQRREIKQQELIKVQESISEIEGVSPEDVQVVEKILRSKGYVTKDEASSMFYESVKQEKLNKFLEKYPEYKPENDPGDANWQMLNREISDWYKMPPNPRKIVEVLERAHKQVRPTSSAPTRPNPAVRRQLEVAGVGSGGAQRSSSSKSLSASKREHLLQGGWTEEDIKNIEVNL